MSDFPKRAPGRQTMLARAVNAMVRAMGGDSVKLRMPVATTGLERELGMTAQLAEEIEVGPAVIRELGLKDGRAQVQVLISANSMQPLMDARGEVSGLAMLKRVESLLYGDRVFRVTGVSAETFAGMEYLWRLEGVE
jgi:hypothetical protein